MARACAGIKSNSKPFGGIQEGDPGVATFMFFNPRTRIGVITFQNNHNGDLFSVVRKLYAVADDL